MACSVSSISASSLWPRRQRQQRWRPNLRSSCLIRAVKASEECNEEECAPTKEVGSLSMEWKAEENSKVVGTYPPMTSKIRTGYVEKDSAGQTSIYPVEPPVYVGESAISTGSAGASSEGSEGTIVLTAGFGLLTLSIAGLILSQESTPQAEVYSGPPLSYYIDKFQVRQAASSTPSLVTLKGKREAPPVKDTSSEVAPAQVVKEAAEYVTNMLGKQVLGRDPRGPMAAKITLSYLAKPRPTYPSLLQAPTVLRRRKSRAMAATTVSASSVASTSAFLGSKSVSVSRASIKPVVGLPALGSSRVVCSTSEKKEQVENVVTGMTASIAAAATTLIAANPALALVDERLSTEGTGLGLGVSSPAFGWVLVAVPFVFWAFFYAFSQTLPSGEDDGGLSL